MINYFNEKVVPPTIPGSTLLKTASINASTIDQLLINKLHVDKLNVVEFHIDEIITNLLTADEIVTYELTTDKLISNELEVNEITTNEITLDEIVADEITTDKLITNDIEGNNTISITPSGVNGKTILYKSVSTPDMIRFTVSFTSTPYNYGNVNNPFIFSHALLNVGNHYNTSTGMFTVPVKGVYSFNATLAVGVALTFNVYFRTTQPVNILGGGVNSGFYASGYSGLIELDVGDQVYVTSTLTGNYVGYTSDTYLSRFSGNLITALL